MVYKDIGLVVAIFVDGNEIGVQSFSRVEGKKKK